MGCDLRILQMEGKRPRWIYNKIWKCTFNNLVDKALSIIEFKVKILKKDLNLENTNDKIKF